MSRLVSTKLWEETLEALRDLKALVRTRTGETKSGASIIHELVLTELAREKEAVKSGSQMHGEN